MDKIKVLFVVGNFYQAGAQRFAYEIDRALDKTRFEITILCLEHSKKINADWAFRYYEQRHAVLGSEIIFIDRIVKENTAFNFFRKVIKKVLKKNIPLVKPEINSFLNKFDLIHWMGEYTFFHNISKLNLSKSIINIMTAKFQNPDMFNEYDPLWHYNFISGFDAVECEYEFSEFSDYNHTRIPLLLKMPFAKKPWSFNNSATPKIGIFTRLDAYKPLDPFFYCFQLLLEKVPNAELHIFGNGDPEKEGMNNFLRRLAITDKVFFRGHQDDLIHTLIHEHIDLSWFQGYKNRPAGYAGFDVCSTGTPLICWDFYDKSPESINMAYPHYKNLTAFVNRSVEILTNREQAEALSTIQFENVRQNHNVELHIQQFENVYLSTIEKNKLVNP